MSFTGRMVVLAVAVAITVAAVAIWAIFRLLLPIQEDTDRQREPQYVIGDWQGKVAVFEGQSDYPMQILEVQTRTLPETQRRQVQQGVPVRDGDRLWQVLEDYTG